MEWLLILLITISGVTSAVGSDSMSADQYITDGETIVSADESFELGFFSPGNSKNRYLGIWFKKIAPGTVVWVANREKPIHDSSGLLKLTPEGILILTNSKSTIWSSNSSTAAVNNPVAQLLDTGNLIVRDGSNDINVDTSNNTLWQSFDYPGNTFVAGMKLGRNIATGLDRFLSSWKNQNDPSQGFFTYKLDHSGLSQLILGNGSVVKFRSGPWNGVRFSGFPQLANISGYIYGFVSNQYEEYYYYEVLKGSATLIMVLNEVGLGQCYVWIDQTREWFLYFSIPPDDCDTYALCGAFGTCNTTRSSKCSCVEGFAPKSPSDWKVGDWSSGCIRRTELDCHGGTDKFFKHSNIKLPDTRQSWFDRSMSLVECERTCLRNCSCTAYSVLNISDHSGCLLWFNELFDIREFTQNGQEIFVRIAGSEVVIEGDNSGGSNSSLQRRPQRRPKIIVGSIVPVILLLGGVAFICIKCTRAGKFCGFGRESQTEDLELPMFDFGTISNATENFLAENKLGQGGYGPVYKGVLKDGQEIAVKRLSENSRQGLVEFKNEVMYIAKLQHRNLVKLLGCCIQEDEKLLVYEFLPNKSLERFIFNEGSTLDWPKRFMIINGIALGLLYLHRDSRLRIIHRDLKAENILLDNELNPKISDFGLARSFGGNESEANTKRVVGTYGYMSPEYAIHGLYSTKSDVFSFGVLVMEIVHGKRNRGFTHLDSSLTLLGHAWTLFKGGRALNLMDETIISSCNLSEVLRSIHVALLCVQNNPKDRPEMSSVVMMLGGESVLPEPKHPGFFTNEILSEGYSSSSKNKIVSANELTISYLGPR